MNVTTSRRAQAARRLARGLGWFSLALGLAECVAPRGLGRAVGVPSPGLWRSYGAREIGAGIGILTARNPERWVWGRVAGDAVDLATLATGLAGRNARPLAALASLAIVGAVTFVDLYCARELGEAGKPKRAVRDYSGRRGFPEPPERMRGAAVRPAAS